MPLQKNHLSLLGYEYVYLNIQEPLRFKYNMQNIFYVLGKCLPCKNFFQKKKSLQKNPWGRHTFAFLHSYLSNSFPIFPNKRYIHTNKILLSLLNTLMMPVHFYLKLCRIEKKKLRKFGDFYNCNCTAGMQCLRVGGG